MLRKNAQAAVELEDLFGSGDESVHLVGPNLDFSSIACVLDADASLLSFPPEPLDGDEAEPVFVAVAAVRDGGDGLRLEEVLAEDLRAKSTINFSSQ